LGARSERLGVGVVAVLGRRVDWGAIAATKATATPQHQRGAAAAATAPRSGLTIEDELRCARPPTVSDPGPSDPSAPGWLTVSCSCTLTLRVTTTHTACDLTRGRTPCRRVQRQRPPPPPPKDKPTNLAALTSRAGDMALRELLLASAVRARQRGVTPC
jgi:hypothetical protein